MIADTKFKITEIQADLGLSNYQFAQMKDDIQQELEEKRFANTTLATNGMRRNIQTIINSIKLKFQNKITSKDKNFIQSAIHRLIYLEKTNLVRYKNVKRSIRTGHTKAVAKTKRPRLDTESTSRPQSIAVSTPLPMSNISATLDDAFNPNQARLTATSPSPYEAADTCLNICEEKNMQDPMRLNVSYILTNVYDENQTNNMFHRALYQTLCNSLQKEGVMGKASNCKLWGWVDAGPSLGW